MVEPNDESEGEKKLREARETMQKVVAYLQNIPNKVFQEEILNMKKLIIELTRKLDEYDFDLFFQLLDHNKVKQVNEKMQFMKYQNNTKEMKAHIKQILREGKEIGRLESYFG